MAFPLSPSPISYFPPLNVAQKTTSSIFCAPPDPFEPVSASSASLFDAENDNDATICSICLDTFDDVHPASTPTLLLPCCHCICRSDAERIFATDRKCPFDRQRISAIQTNFALRDFIATNKRKEREKFVDEFSEVVEQMQKAEKEKAKERENSTKSKDKSSEEFNPFESDTEAELHTVEASAPAVVAAAPESKEPTNALGSTSNSSGSEEKAQSGTSSEKSSTTENVMENAPSHPPAQSACDECQQVATVFCNDCRLSFCNKCDIELIHKAKSLSSHQRIPLMEKQPVEDFCAVHPKTAVSLYCERCGILCCPLCPFHSTHRSHFHRMKDLKEVKPKFIGKLCHVYEQAEAYECILQEWQQRKRNAAAESCQEVLTKLPELLQSLHAAVDRMGNRIADGVLEFQRGHEQRCDEFESEFKEVHGAFQQIRKSTGKFLRSSSASSDSAAMAEDEKKDGKAEAYQGFLEETKTAAEEAEAKQAMDQALRSASVSELFRMNEQVDKLRRQYESELSTLFHASATPSNPFASSATSTPSSGRSSFVHCNDSINIESLKNLYIMLENHLKSFQLPLRKKVLPPDFLAVKYAASGVSSRNPVLSAAFPMASHKRKKNNQTKAASALDWDDGDPFGMFFSASAAAADSSAAGSSSSAAVPSAAASSSSAALPGCWFLLPGSPAARWMDDPFISAFEQPNRATSSSTASSAAAGVSAASTANSASAFSFISQPTAFRSLQLPMSSSHSHSLSHTLAQAHVHSDPWTEMVDLSPTVPSAVAASTSAASNPSAISASSSASAAAAAAPSSFHFVFPERSLLHPDDFSASPAPVAQSAMGVRYQHIT